MMLRHRFNPTFALLSSALALAMGCGASSSDDGAASESAAQSERPSGMNETSESSDDAKEPSGTRPGDRSDSATTEPEPAPAGDPGDPADDEDEEDAPEASGMDPEHNDTSGDEDGDGAGTSDDETGENPPAVDEPEPPRPGEADCTSSCPVPRICMACGDGCAEAFVPCTDDGECGELTWLCDGEPAVEPEPEPKPGEHTCPATCPVLAICHLCDDGSCASADVSCNDDGSCGEVDWVCAGEPADIDPAPDFKCRSVADCPQILAVCTDCPNGDVACPVMQCIEGQCVTTGNECGTESQEYDPCSGKGEGETCSHCPPGSIDCLETGEIKTCQRGKCESGTGARR